MTSCCAPAGSSGTGPSAPLPAHGGSAPGLVEVRAGTFLMGYEGPLAHPGDAEGPVRPVEVAAFRIGATAVAVDAFAEFVRATGWVTEAEQAGWSFVFGAQVVDAAAVRGRVLGAEWWSAVDGASWRAPGGPGTAALGDHPAVHVSTRDAEAYCAWTGTRLPTEAEWERAARGGLEQAVFPWGDELRPDGAWRANTWQGVFPVQDTGEDGHAGTAPVDAFPPNGFGLHQAVGNVWEWTASPWSASDARRVRRGGSYLCHDSWCNRYRVAARDAGAPGDSAGNVGFRVAAGAV